LHQLAFRPIIALTPQGKKMAALTLQGRVILITGAARGLGRCYADLLAAKGARIVVNDLGVERDGAAASPDPADDAARAIRDAGGEAIADASDVALPEGAQTLIETALRRWGRIDSVINNAGIFLGQRPFLETTLEDFLQVWRVHVGGTYNLCRAVLPYLLAQGHGSILNSCSIQGLYGAATSADYAAAKGAVQALTLSLAASTSGTAVRVNAISPGGFTRMVSGESRGEEITRLLQASLDPALAAPVAAWLCHPDCTAHGQIFQAYAGRVSRTVIGELPGFWDLDLTIEQVAAHMDDLSADGPLLKAPDSASMAHLVVTEALRRRQERDGLSGLGGGPGETAH
jgi:3-hydroxyacyl-CoA dehydrogenase/3a,7a,12a-trihydroxy-5b-cholest-24-enoyl-CoA hydratase